MLSILGKAEKTKIFLSSGSFCSRVKSQLNLGQDDIGALRQVSGNAVGMWE